MEMRKMSMLLFRGGVFCNCLWKPESLDMTLPYQQLCSHVNTYKGTTCKDSVLKSLIPLGSRDTCPWRETFPVTATVFLHFNFLFHWGSQENWENNSCMFICFFLTYPKLVVLGFSQIFQLSSFQTLSRISLSCILQIR